MPCVEIGTCAARPQIREVAYQSSSRVRVRHIVVCDFRDIVDGMRKSVVKFKLQALREPLAHVHQKPILVRAGVISDVAVRPRLRRQAHVVIQETVRKQTLNRVRQVPLVD